MNHDGRKEKMKFIHNISEKDDRGWKNKGHSLGKFYWEEFII